MWKWVIGIAALPVGAAGLVYGVGALLPRAHVARADAILPAPADAVAAMVRDVEAQPRWRTGVREIEVLERRERGLRYVERSGDGAITFDFAEEIPGRQFRSNIADHDLPFGGYWTIVLASAGEGTRIEIEEHGFVTNPFYRFFSSLVLGHENTMKTYLADMRRGLAG